MRSGRILTALTLLSLVAGCERDAKKLERLQQEKALACLRPDYLKSKGAPADSIAAAVTQCTLAERDLNRFMQGR